MQFSYNQTFHSVLRVSESQQYSQAEYSTAHTMNSTAEYGYSTGIYGSTVFPHPVCWKAEERMLRTREREYCIDNSIYHTCGLQHLRRECYRCAREAREEYERRNPLARSIQPYNPRLVAPRPQRLRHPYAAILDYTEDSSPKEQHSSSLAPSSRDWAFIPPTPRPHHQQATLPPSTRLPNGPRPAQNGSYYSNHFSETTLEFYERFPCIPPRAPQARADEESSIGLDFSHEPVRPRKGHHGMSAVWWMGFLMLPTSQELEEGFKKQCR